MYFDTHVLTRRRIVSAASLKKSDRGALQHHVLSISLAFLGSMFPKTFHIK